jgi:DNA-directed RNA polymerase specialized sigma24 family protein
MGLVIPRKPFNLEVARDMREDGKSLKHVAEHFSMSVETVRKRLIEAGDDTSHANFSWRENAPKPTGNLKPMEVLAVLAYHAYGFGLKETAEWLNIPQSTTGSHLSAGTRKLRARGLQDA